MHLYCSGVKFAAPHFRMINKFMAKVSIIDSINWGLFNNTFQIYK